MCERVEVGVSLDVPRVSPVWDVAEASWMQIWYVA